MPNVWRRKMEQFTTFSQADRALLDDIVSRKCKIYGPREDLICEGEHSPECRLVLSGLICRYKVLDDGRRQIMGFLLPGDLCDAEIFILKQMDHNIGTLAKTAVAAIPADTMKELLLNRPGIAMAVWWATLQDEAILRERLVDLGRRDAYQRLAFHLFEIFVRLRMVGMTDGNEFEFAATQTDLADATGLTPVYVNRTLHRLRDHKLISTDGRRWSVLDVPGLKRAAQFNGDYLHLDRSTDDPGSDAAKSVSGLL